ncbi:MAG: hypothetical protein ACR2OJ_02580 [Hyphomicrobiales bacterium]
MMNKELLLPLFAFATTVMCAQTALATSGPGCFTIIGVGNDDVLNIRFEPAAGSKLTGTMSPRDHGIIHSEGACTPKSVEPAQRWCPIIHYNGGGTTIGFVKRKFLEDSDCP